MAQKKITGGHSIMLHKLDDQIAERRVPDKEQPSEEKIKANSNLEIISKRNGLRLSKMHSKTRRLVQTIEYVADLISRDIDKDIEQLTPYQRVTLWKDLQEYLRPKLQRKEIVGEDGGPVKTQHTVVLRPHASPALPESQVSVDTIEGENSRATTVTERQQDGSISQNIATIKKVPNIDVDDNEIQEIDVEVVK